MAGDPEQEKLDTLGERIRQAELKANPAAEQSAPLAGQGDLFRAGRIGFDFVAAVMVCAFIGWIADRGMGTAPWGLMVMIFLGFCAGIMNVWRALNGYGQAVGLKKDSKE